MRIETTSTCYDGPEQPPLTFETLLKATKKLKPIVAEARWNDYKMASNIGCAIHTNLLTGDIEIYKKLPPIFSILPKRY